MKTTFQTNELNKSGKATLSPSLVQNQKQRMLEKNYTRQPHIANFMAGIKKLPEIEVGRPGVKAIKKRVNLLLKG